MRRSLDQTVAGCATFHLSQRMGALSLIQTECREAHSNDYFALPP